MVLFLFWLTSNQPDSVYTSLVFHVPAPRAVDLSLHLKVTPEATWQTQAAEEDKGKHVPPALTNQCHTQTPHFLKHYLHYRAVWSHHRSRPLPFPLLCVWQRYACTHWQLGDDDRRLLYLWLALLVCCCPWRNLGLGQRRDVIWTLLCHRSPGCAWGDGRHKRNLEARKTAE